MSCCIFMIAKSTADIRYSELMLEGSVGWHCWKFKVTEQVAAEKKLELSIF